MPALLQEILLFALGLLLLIKGGDWFVDGATGIAARFHIPEILIGATVVSIGTTIPEVMVSAISAVEGHSEIAYGNAVGSVICNTSLIAAISVAIKPGKVDAKALRTPTLFFFGAAVFYGLVAIITGNYSRPVGIILLAGFVGYMILTVIQAKRDTGSPVSLPEEGDKPAEQEKVSPLWKDILFLVLGAACIAFGADFLVDNGTLIAKDVGVPESVIALTFVALGTSLPELVTAITSLAKGHSSLSVGNVIGANLFNLVLVSGVATTLNPFVLPASKMVGGMSAALVVDLPVMFAVMLLLTLPALFRGKLSRWQGITLLAIYAGYCTFQFVA